MRTSGRCARVRWVWPAVVAAALLATGCGGGGEESASTTSGSASFTGPWSAQFSIRAVGIPASAGGQDGTLAGNGELAQGQLALLATTAEGTFFAQTPYNALGGPADNPAKDFMLPVLNGQLC